MKKYSKNQKKRFLDVSPLNKLGVFATTLLTAVTAVCVYAPVDIRTNALDGVDVTFTINPRVSMSLEANNLNFNVNTTQDGNFVSGDIVAHVDTSSTGGYKLFFSAEDNDTAARATGSNTPIKSDFSSTVTASTMPKDKWGYSLNNIQFGKIPTLSEPEMVRNLDHHPSTDETINHVYIGAKLSNNLDAGVYRKTVVFTATANDDLPIPSGSTMQGFSESSLEMGETATVVDTRNGKSYQVKKYPDGTVWMIDDLRLSDIQINSSTSNVPAGVSYTIPASDITAFTDADDLEATYDDPTYGTYYSYKTATAGWGTSTVSSGNSPYDICPKGWMIPTFDHYFRLLDLDDNSDVANGKYVNSGFIANGVIKEQTEGYLWTSTVHSLESGYLLEMHPDIGLSDYFGTKFLGMPVRCVLKNTDSNKTMQGFKPASLQIGGSTVLTDTRDNSIYRVKRLADGKVWMTESLRITNKAISSADSNVSAAMYIPQNDRFAFAPTEGSIGVYTDPNSRGVAGGAFYTYAVVAAGADGVTGAESVASGDICPRGWRLPTKDEYQNIIFSYSTYDALRSSSGPYFWLSGYANNVGSYNHLEFHLGDQETGYYWTSQAGAPVEGKSSAYALYLDKNQKKAVVNAFDRAFGFNARCVAKN